MWQILNEFLYTRSFLALWFWIATAAVMAYGVRGVLGIPVRLVNNAWRETRDTPWSRWARKHGAYRQSRNDAGLLTQAAHSQAKVYMRLAQRTLLARTAAQGLIWGVLSALAFRYEIELARAMWLLATPLILVSGINTWAAWQISTQPELQGAAMADVMLKFNIFTQIVIFSFIFIIFSVAFVRISPIGYMG